MEAAQNKIVRNTESSSAISHSNETDANELSKEKEEDLLFDKEDVADDEDVLSDDSLRLRLSDDEEAEQEEHIVGRANISELKSKKQQFVGVIAEEKLCSDSQQVMKKVTKSGSEKPIQEKHNTAVNVPENSTLSSNDCTTENKPMQNERCDSESSCVTVTAIQCNEKYILNMPEKIQSDCHDKETSYSVDNANNESQLTHNYDKDIAENKILNDDLKKKGNKLNSISRIGEINDACTSAISKQHILENDKSSTNNCTKPNSHQNADLITYIEDNLKEMATVCKEINSTNTCKLNNLDATDSDNPLTDSVNVNIDNNELSSTSTIVSNNCDDDLTILTDEIVGKVTTCDTKYLKLLTKEDHDKNSDDVVRSNKFEDKSLSHNIRRECKEKDIKHEDVTQKNKDVEKMQSVQQTNIALTQNQNDLSNIKDTTEMKNEDHNFNKSVNQIVHNNSLSVLLKEALLTPINAKDTNNKNKTESTGTIVQRRKRLRKNATLDINAEQNCATEEDKQGEKESGRQKRKTARNAEEIIRKKYLNSDSDSSDSEEQYVPLTHKVYQDSHSASSSLKRNCPNNENHVLNGVKKVKMNVKSEEKSSASDITKLSFVEKFFQRDIKDKLQKFTQAELEELLIQKIVETITMRSEIGQLREQARLSEKYQEATRTKLQQLIKQVKDFEMVLTRNAIERRANSDKFVPPVKVNRSVGLQVNFITEHGIQNLRQIQQSSQLRSANISSNISSPAPEANINTPNSRRGIKIRSPRRTETPMIAPAPAISQSSVQTTPLISTVTPAALVVAKPLESQHTLTLPSQTSNVQQLLSAPQQQIQSQPHQAIVLNGKIQNQVNRSATTLIAPKQKNNDLIDLTDEEEKSKSNIKITSVPTTSLLEHQLSGTSKPAQCFQRVIQTIPTNVAITQPTSIRVVQPNQPTPTALVNNINQPKLAYVMQSGVGTTRQLLITSNATQIRPVTTCRSSLPTVTYKTGNSTIANGTVRVLSTSAVSNVQVNKHPAPLPDISSYAMTPGWKLPPPAPSLKISKVANGIVLSWNMTLTDKYADIASYQLYAYQEVAGVNPSTSLWKKVGDVRALPLPMACTLTQFSEGNNYYFAVRAVDTHSRKGQYSIPGNISL